MSDTAYMYKCQSCSTKFRQTNSQFCPECGSLRIVRHVNVGVVGYVLKDKLPLLSALEGEVE